MAKNNEWRDPGHIDAWEDMLPEERQYEIEHGPGMAGVWALVIIFAALYYAVKLFGPLFR